MSQKEVTLSRGTIAFLYVVSTLPKGTTYYGLMKLTGMVHSTVKCHIAELRRHGLVDVESNGVGGRNNLAVIRLSEAGARIVEDLKQRSEERTARHVG